MERSDSVEDDATFKSAVVSDTVIRDETGIVNGAGDAGRMTEPTEIDKSVAETDNEFGEFSDGQQVVVENDIAEPEPIVQPLAPAESNSEAHFEETVIVEDPPEEMTVEEEADATPVPSDNEEEDEGEEETVEVFRSSGPASVEEEIPTDPPMTSLPLISAVPVSKVETREISLSGSFNKNLEDSLTAFTSGNASSRQVADLALNMVSCRLIDCS